MTKTGINVEGPGRLFTLALTIGAVFAGVGALPLLIGGLIGSNWGEEGAHNGMEVVLIAFYAITWLTWASKFAFWTEKTAPNQAKR